MTSRKKYTKYWIALMILLLAGGVWTAVSLTILNEQWLAEQIETYVHEKYQADINITSLEFSPWHGTAALSGVTVHQAKPDQTVDADIERIALEVQVWSLVFGDLMIERLVITHPDIHIDVQRKPEPIPAETSERLSKMLFAVTYEVFIRPAVEAFGIILSIFTGEMHQAIIIDDLAIHQGTIHYTSRRVGNEPFAMEVRELEYAAKDIHAKVPFHFVATADITAKVLLNGTEVDFSHLFAQKPYTVSISDIDLGYLDRLLKQKDILRIQQGKMNMNFLSDDESLTANVQFRDLQLSQNNTAIHKDFAFIPAGKIIEYVNQSAGNMNLEFELEQSEIHTSQDLDFIVLEMWEGMWKATLKKASSDTLKEFKEKGTQKLIDFLKKNKSSDNEKDE